MNRLLALLFAALMSGQTCALTVGDYLRYRAEKESLGELKAYIAGIADAIMATNKRLSVTGAAGFCMPAEEKLTPDDLIGVVDSAITGINPRKSTHVDIPTVMFAAFAHAYPCAKKADTKYFPA